MKPSFLQEVEADPNAAATRLMRIANSRDGLPEIAIGTILLTTAFLLWLQVAYSRGSFAYQASWWGMILLMMPMIGGSQWAIKWVRRRFLIEKTRLRRVEARPQDIAYRRHMHRLRGCGCNGLGGPPAGVASERLAGRGDRNSLGLACGLHWAVAPLCRWWGPDGNCGHLSWSQQSLV